MSAPTPLDMARAVEARRVREAEAAALEAEWLAVGLAEDGDDYPVYEPPATAFGRLVERSFDEYLDPLLRRTLFAGWLWAYERVIDAVIAQQASDREAGRL